MKKITGKIGIVVFALLFTLSAFRVDAKREEREFNLGKAKGFARPYVLIIPIPASKEGRIGVYAKVESYDRSRKKPGLSFAIVLKPKRGKTRTLTASWFQKGKNGVQLRYDLDSVDLRSAKEIYLVIANFSTKRRASGRVLIAYPVKGEESTAAKPLYPDLAIKGIRLGPDCSVEVLLVNNGPAKVAPVFWDKKVVSLKVYVNGRLWGGGEGLKVIDPNKNLRKLGNIAIYRSTHRVKGTETVKAELIVHEPLRDNEKGNNVKTASLTCAGPPDLAIDSVMLTRNCKVRVRVVNLGGPIPQALWQSKNAPMIFLYRNGKPWGGQTVAQFDSRKKLSRQNGTVIYVSNFKIRGSERIRAVIDSNDVLKETSEVNNALEAVLTCR